MKAYTLVVIAAAMLSTSALANNLPDLANGFDLPNGSPTGYELDYNGDVSGLIPTQVAGDPVINPWEWFHENVPGRNVNPTTVTYDNFKNLTRVVLSGDPLDAQVPANYPYYNIFLGPAYHTGLNAGFINQAPPCSNPPVAGSMCLVSRHWIYGNTTQELDALNVNWTGHAKKKGLPLQWLLTFIGTADPKSRLEHSGFWKLTAFDPSGAKKFSVSNTGAEPITIDRIGYQTGVPVSTDPECQQNPTCPENEEILDSLNFGKFPPPGDDGSQFVNLPLPKTLKPGKIYKFELP